MRSRTPKRAAAERKYLVARRRFLEDNPRCAAADLDLPVVCSGRADTIQHLAGRRGERLLDEALWLGLCWPHHQYAELHPTEAKALGLAKSKVGAA